MQSKPKESRMKELIKDIREINKLENRKRN